MCTFDDGGFPVDLCNPSQMKHYIHYSSTINKIPECFFRTNARNLLYFSLVACHIPTTIPTEIGLLTSLTRLALHDVSFNSTLPSQLGALTNLQVLVLKDLPGVHGGIPDEVKALPNLRFFSSAGSPLECGDNANTSSWCASFSKSDEKQHTGYARNERVPPLRC